MEEGPDLPPGCTMWNNKDNEYCEVQDGYLTGVCHAREVHPGQVPPMPNICVSYGNILPSCCHDNSLSCSAGCAGLTEYMYCLEFPFDQ